MPIQYMVVGTLKSRRGRKTATREWGPFINPDRAEKCVLVVAETDNDVSDVHITEVD